MSYCRWSSDDFDCDVYVYEDTAGGWTTHVAGMRVSIDRSGLPPEDADVVGSWIGRYQAVMDLVQFAGRQPIGLPHDGETFSDPTPGACADRLEELRALGYHVPQWAIDELRKEHEP